MTTTTDTPRTDAFWANGNNTGDELDPLCRQLERELLTARDDAFNLANALSKAEAEVERLRSTLCRALEIADEFWDNQKQAVLVYHQELADKLDQINLTHRMPRSRG